ncbi:enoyl-CoA hydratase/isomerase family protein [Stappia sp.]|uniref:enoyl-CoA hydratase/isomerase family protein n=1 Tax=Stappia sp. TaxID=1870903 RepID=UPI0032D8BC61
MVSRNAPARSIEVPDVLIRIEGRAGRITLNRPRALNTLTGAMVAAMHTALDAWAEDTRVALVLIDAAGTRAFCAGGDIAEVHALVAAGDLEAARVHVAREYRLDLKIAGYAKPVVALMDGRVMGGGLGISAHARHPVATDRTQAALPECALGWVPDSGASALLAAMPETVATYLALSGAQLSAGDAVGLGVARHIVPAAARDTLTQALCDSGRADEIADFECPPPPGPLAGRRAEIDAVFSASTVAECLDRLDAMAREAGDDAGNGAARERAAWASGTARAIRRHAPLALTLALALLRQGRCGPAPGDLRAAIAREYGIVCQLLETPDFKEGIRALLIDRDRAPRWRQTHDHRFEEAEIDAWFTRGAGFSLSAAFSLADET